MKKITVLALCFLLLATNYGFKKIEGKRIYKKGWIDLNKNGKKDPYEDPSVAIEDRITNLISLMNIEEKTCQMVTLYGYGRVLRDDLPNEGWKEALWKDGLGAMDEHLNGFQGWGKPPMDNPNCWPASNHAKAMNEVQRFFIENTRLGIPVDFTNEGIRGIENYMATNFPTQLAIGQTWNRDLVNKIGDITGKEARILGYTNVYAPILDVGRDQRWGRMEEVYGESPYLVAELGVAMTKGLQKDNQVAATAKHFAIYANNKGAREGLSRVDPQVAPRETENIHLYPFKRVIREAGLKGVMSSYNDYDGVPIQSSPYYLQDKLRKEYGFKGYVVSDSDAVIYLYNKHKTAKDYKEAVRQSVIAGLNVRCTFRSPDSFVEPLRELIAEGSISEDIINDRVRDVLRVKFEIGLFDHPYIENPAEADEVVDCDAHHEVALQASRESIVLLKNEKQLLPLKKDKIKRIAVCGPNADDAAYALTHYGPLAGKVYTVLGGLKERVGNDVEIVYTKGCELVDANWPDSEILPVEMNADERAEIEKAVAQAKQSDVAVVVVGGSQRTCGENKSRSSLNLPGYQLDLVKAVQATGTPTVVVVISGRPLSINWTSAYVPAIVQSFYPGAYGGLAIADVLLGDYNPGGKLTVTVPKTTGQLPFNFPVKQNAQIDAMGVGGLKGKRARVNGALYPFGYGLSYTTFKYTDLQISPRYAKQGESITVSCKVKNTGDVAGDEVVQLYYNDVVSSVTTYEKNLRGFERITLNAGEEKQVSFTVTPDDLSLLNVDMKRVVEDGEFTIMVGASSEDIRLKSSCFVGIDEESQKNNDSQFITVTDNQNDAALMVDGKKSTAWETLKQGMTVNLELNSDEITNEVSIAWANGEKQSCDFEILLSGGGGQYVTVYEGKSSGKTADAEVYKFGGFPATDLQVKIKINHGSDPMGISEIKVKTWKGKKVER
ncbi:beta-glucosidase [Puteibacter caeruleilacunae]|nr:beta-glucosidase [Puteibacter caeruleilacunae]